MSRLHRLSAAALLAAPSFGRISPDEETLLREWVHAHAELYDEFSVDVPVSGGRGDGSPLLNAADFMWAAITRRRIDLVAVDGPHVDIIEAKMHARMPTVTQVLKYCDAYRADHPEAFSVSPVILCRSATPGLAALLEQHHGELIEWPELGRRLTVSA